MRIALSCFEKICGDQAFLIVHHFDIYLYIRFRLWSQVMCQHTVIFNKVLQFYVAGTSTNNIQNFIDRNRTHISTKTLWQNTKPVYVHFKWMYHIGERLQKSPKQSLTCKGYWEKETWSLKHFDEEITVFSEKDFMMIKLYCYLV